MDPMHFSIKRVYWSGHARIRELVVPLGITPARADLLRVVAMHDHGMLQVTLMQHLGVSPPTISKMLSAMVEKGWVERFASKSGNIIHATRAGLVLIAQVIERFLLSGALPLRMAMAWGHGPGDERDGLYRLLNRARRALLDRAPFLHPWRRESTYVRRQYTFWEARLRADDVDDRVAEDLEKIRARAKAPIASPPPPRTAREQENIDAHRRDRDADPDGPLMWSEPREGTVSASPPATVGVPTEEEAVFTAAMDIDSARQAEAGEGVGTATSGDDPRGLAAHGDDPRGLAAHGDDPRGLAAHGDDPRGLAAHGDDARGLAAHSDDGGAIPTNSNDDRGSVAWTSARDQGRLPVTSTTVDGKTNVAIDPAIGEAPFVDGSGIAAAPFVEGEDASAVADVPPEIVRLWKNLMEIGNVRGLGLEDMPKWDESET